MYFISSSETDTVKIAFDFAKQLKAGDVVAFFGNLGAGKTVFIKGIAKYFNVKEYVTSPTFIIVNEYDGDIPLYHFDMYRIKDEDALYDIGFFDYINADGICLIEWSENIKAFLPKEYYKITIDRFKDEREENEYARIIKIENVLEEA
jgi:tRNA threonylcarbamoyladenosine biosynthesis protein TsaE